MHYDIGLACRERQSTGTGKEVRQDDESKKMHSRQDQHSSYQIVEKRTGDIPSRIASRQSRVFHGKKSSMLLTGTDCSSVSQSTPDFNDSGAIAVKSFSMLGCRGSTARYRMRGIRWKSAVVGPCRAGVGAEDCGGQMQ